MASWTGNLFKKESALLLKGAMEYVWGRPVGDEDWLSSLPEENSNKSVKSGQIGNLDAVILQQSFLKL